ncbi:MAG TPA: MFS transporter [Streptomyces sp.]|nr:MFS transporter [Streptomyces sp.]
MSFPRLRRSVAASVSGLPAQFWWLWTSTLISRLGAFVATFLALYLTAERGFSASYAGLVVALFGLGGAVASVTAGVLTDRLGRRPTMLVAQCSAAVSIAVLGFMERPVTIAALTFLVGLTSNASRPAVQAMLADVVAPADRVRAFALNYWAINLGFAVSSTAAGLIAQYSYHALFLGEATMLLCCAVVVVVKLPETRPEQGGGAAAEGSDGGGPAAARVSVGTVLRDGRFMAVVALNLLVALAFLQTFTALPISMGRAGFSSADFGTVIALNGLLIVVLQLPLTRLIEHRSPARLLVVSSLLVGWGLGIQAFAGSTLALYVVALCIWTLGEMINSPTQMGLVVRLSPLHGRGRYQGMFNLSWGVASLVGPLIGGVVIDRYGSPALWGGTAVVGTLAAVGYGLLLRSLPAEQPTVPAVTAGPAGEAAPGGEAARHDAAPA